MQAIVAIPEHAARNRAITAAYFELSLEMRRRLPGAANWCTFAMWASQQAGVTIRHEDLLDALRQRLRASVEIQGLAELVTARIGELGPLRRAGEAVARGNRKVFEEIGLVFARFLDRFDQVAAIADADLDDFVASLREGEPPEGQQLLRQAFIAYRSAALARDPHERAEWLLVANLSIGCHEQIRLQPEIRAALDAAAFDPEPLVASLAAQLGDPEGGVRRNLRRWLPFVATPLRKRAARVAAEATALVREVVTEHVMTLRLDRVVIRLGHDVQQQCPPELRQPRVPALLELLARVDPNPGGVLGSGATDWSDFPQRMHFICELFRAWQHDERLFATPHVALRLGRENVRE